jgi:glycosyltransferase involved in cell wall biosynthesis
MKVSLVGTVKNAGNAVDAFLRSLRAQTRAPDEVVIVDGGSTDGTLEALEAAEGITVISEPGANIARGRNVAIRAAAHDVIAVTDPDCAMAPDWLERIVAPLEAGADVAMGFYRPAPASFFEACAATLVKEADEFDDNSFMPSARSVAFRREAIEVAGGYPEDLDFGEDMSVNHRWRELGLRMEFVPEALVWWPVRPTLAATWRQYANYAEGDAVAGMHPRRHALRASVYLAAPRLWRRGGKLRRAALVTAAFLYAYRPINRAWRTFEGRPLDRATSMFAVPALMAFVDAAKLTGYVRGHMRGRRP